MKQPVQGFWLPKKGNSVEEYEDALDFSRPQRRFAVADGATESAFAESWARSLVLRFVEAPPTLSPSSGDHLPEWLEPLQQQWRQMIAWEQLPWFAVEKARAGAFATLLGVVFFDDENPQPAVATDAQPSDKFHWQALAVGDCCLFHVRGDELLAAFPLDQSVQFGNHPVLLSSNPANNRRVWEQVHFNQGQAQSDDLFFLTTDALAHWFLSQIEAGAKPWLALSELNHQEEFVALIARLREQHTIRNDDTTLLVIRIGDTTFSEAETLPSAGNGYPLATQAVGGSQDEVEGAAPSTEEEDLNVAIAGKIEDKSPGVTGADERSRRVPTTEGLLAHVWQGDEHIEQDTAQEGESESRIGCWFRKRSRRWFPYGSRR